MGAEIIFDEKKGYGQLADASIASYPENEAIIFGDWRITYRELGKLINQTCHFLRGRGVKQGDKVAIISRNCPECLVADLAILKLGAVTVKINWRLHPSEMQYLLETNKATFAFFRAEKDEWGQQMLESCGDTVDFIRLEEIDGRSALYTYLDGMPDSAIDVEIDREDEAYHLHTSGTTGRPKNVVLTHAALMDQIRFILENYNYYAGQRYQFIAQLFHSGAIGAYMSLCRGGSLVLMNSFSADNYIQSLIKEKVTMISVMPTVLKWILDEIDKHGYDLSQLDTINYSTCPIPPALLVRAMDMLDCKFYQSYGMTEMATTITTLSPEDHFTDNGKHLSSVGKAITGASYKIVRDDGSECAVREIGEIVVKGAGRMKCYLDQPELTEKVFTDGWYHTKDMGYVDEEGFLYVSGRADDLIISGGENIYPAEITNVIMQLTEDISEVAVYGVKDEVWGERVKASVVRMADSKITADDIKNHCRIHMPSFRVPKEIEFLSALPKNATGKTAFNELKNR